MRYQKKAYATATSELHGSVIQYAPLVRRLAYQIASRLPPNVELDDLIQDGMMGLLDAMKRYEPRPGLNFEAYARFRITGAIYDSCRENDVLPRNQRDKLSDLENAIRRLEQELGRHPTDQEVADHCELSIAEYHQTLEINSFRQISERLAQVIKDLPEKERMVVALHYQEDLSFREVATVLDLTPGRISQIHTQAMLRIRSVLGTDPSFR